MGCVIRCYIASLALLLVLPEMALAAPPLLGLPIKCIPGSSCFIQNYFDNDPTAEYSDYACGHLSYNGHHGTDFRLLDLVSMRTHVAVLAAASGVVVGTRDSEPDISVKKRGTAGLNGKDAGNGVRIDHADGWATQYSHMLKGSLRVHAGQQVEMGDVLGFVGLSGNTEFPHLDFSVSKDGRHIDPFNPEHAACGTSPVPLWSTSVQQLLRYQATGLLISGFSIETPERDTAEDGGYILSTMPADADNIVFWVELFGVNKGDQLSVVITGPNQKQIARHEKEIPRNMAVLFTSTGRRREGAIWPTGTYSALLRLTRNGSIITEERRDIMVSSVKR